MRQMLQLDACQPLQLDAVMETTWAAACPTHALASARDPAHIVIVRVQRCVCVIYMSFVYICFVAVAIVVVATVVRLTLLTCYC